MRTRRVAAALALILLPMLAAPVRAAEPSPLPAEPGARVLDGEVVAATTGDVDGDGVADLVRVVRSDSNPTLLAVDAWSVDGAGSWTQHAQVPLRREASVDRQLSGLPRPDADGMLPVRYGDPVGLLTVGSASSSPGGSRVMVAAIGTGDEDPACCLTVWEVGTRLSAAASSVTLELALASGRGAAFVLAARLDPDSEGDHDEILVADTDAAEAPRITALRWSGARYHEIGRTSFPPGSTLLTWESKPTPPGPWTCFIETRNAQVAVLGPPPAVDDDVNAYSYDFSELSVVDGRLVEVAGAVPPRYAEVVASRSDGVALYGVDLLTPWFGWAWPGASDEPLGPQFPNPLATAFGGDPWTPLLLAADGGFDRLQTVIQVAYPCGSELATLPTSRAAARFPLGRVGGTPVAFSLLPYRGEVPGGLGDRDGGAGIIADGNLLTIKADGGVAIHESAALPGMVPIGLVGPNGGWMALAESPRFPIHSRGFRLDTYQVGDASRVSVARVEEILSPEAEGGSFQPRLVGAVLDPTSALGDLLTSGAGFRAEVEVPPGSRLFVAPLGEGFPIDPTWEGRADDGHAVLQIAVPAGRNSFNVRGFVVTPAGHGYTVAWHLRVLSEPPPLQVEAEWASLGFEVPLHGSTDPAATVLVNGTAVAVAADGTFTAHAAAPPWPTSVTVEAVDLVGNRTAATLSVVGLIDYRQLPWIQIIVVLTVVAGAGLFLLAPRLRPPSPTPQPDDGTLEDIDDR
ncbi:MAG: hypothetical protein OEW24_04845 [Chloroflexota bacterium]|nr:hypothetical protein [Chloroflexota bacterium]